MNQNTIPAHGLYLPLQSHFNMTEEKKPTPEEAIKELAKYFTSGNCQPVDAATIRARDFFEITGLNPSDYVKKT